MQKLSIRTNFFNRFLSVNIHNVLSVWVVCHDWRVVRLPFSCRETWPTVYLGRGLMDKLIAITQLPLQETSTSREMKERHEAV